MGLPAADGGVDKIRTLLDGKLGMVYFIKDTLTAEDHAVWQRLAILRDKAIRKKRRDAIRIWIEGKLTGVLSAVFGGLTLFAVAKGDMPKPYAFFSLLFIIGGVMIFWKEHFPVQRAAGLPEKDFPPSGLPDMPVRAVFFEDGSFTFWEASKKIRSGYQAVDSVWEDSGCFYLFFQERPPLVLPKRGLGRQGSEGFRRFLKQVLGKPVQQIERREVREKD